MSITTTLRRGGVALGCAVLASVTLAPAAQAHEEPDRRAKAIAAGWLNTRLDDGLLHAAFDGGSGPIEYADYGGTVEAAYALDAVDRTRLLPRIADALRGDVDSYITGAGSGEPDDRYAGPTGKLLAFASELDGDDPNPTAFGGTNLVTRMEALTTDDGEDAGRIADLDVAPYNFCTGPNDTPCDYANVFGQIWAARGLLNVASGEASAAVDFLLSQQCDDGHFPTYFDASCAAGQAGPDATALAVVLLSDYAASDDALATALDEAVEFLVGFQSANGSFADDQGLANANSTGLAGWALGIAEREKAAQKAAVWLRALQVAGRPCDGKLARHRGAIAFTKASFQDGVEDGITALTAGEWQTVGVQATPALAHAPAPHVKLGISVPARSDAGGTLRARVSGLAPGERACVGIGKQVKAVVGPRGDKPLSVRVKVPGKGKKTVKVLTANASAADSTTAR